MTHFLFFLITYKLGNTRRKIPGVENCAFLDAAPSVEGSTRSWKGSCKAAGHTALSCYLAGDSESSESSLRSRKKAVKSAACKQLLDLPPRMLLAARFQKSTNNARTNKSTFLQLICAFLDGIRNLLEKAHPPTYSEPEFVHLTNFSGPFEDFPIAFSPVNYVLKCGRAGYNSKVKIEKFHRVKGSCEYNAL